MVPLVPILNTWPKVPPLSVLNLTTGSELVELVSHQPTITLSSVASTSKSVELDQLSY